MQQVPITVGLRVEVDISGLQVTQESAGASVSVSIGSGPGMTARATGTVIEIDRANGQIIVRLDGEIAGRSVYPFPPERIIAAIV